MDWWRSIHEQRRLRYIERRFGKTVGIVKCILNGSARLYFRMYCTPQFTNNDGQHMIFAWDQIIDHVCCGEKD